MPISVTAPLRIVADGFLFTEDPRWHAGRLYFSDTIAGTVYSVDERGALDTVVKLHDHCSGLGFMPNGDLLIVSAGERRLLRKHSDGDSVREHADLSAFTPQAINDMAVDASGRAYVGDLIYDPAQPLQPHASHLFLVQADGAVELAAENMLMANGTVFSADGKTLIVAETMGSRITAFTIGEYGRLSQRRVFAQLPEGYFPDGISLDAHGAVWAACPAHNGVIRVEEGGRITHTLAIPDGRSAYACMLGGADGRTLFLCTAETHDQARLQAARSARIEAVRLDVTAG